MLYLDIEINQESGCKKIWYRTL